MNPRQRLAVFAVILVAAFGGGWGIGQAWPADGTRTPVEHDMHTDPSPTTAVTATTHDMASMP